MHAFHRLFEQSSMTTHQVFFLQSQQLNQRHGTLKVLFGLDCIYESNQSILDECEVCRRGMSMSERLHATMTWFDPFVFQLVENNKSTQKQKTPNNSAEQFHVRDVRWEVFVLDRVVQRLTIGITHHNSAIVGNSKNSDLASRFLHDVHRRMNGQFPP
jgi:hypothetical protein